MHMKIKYRQFSHVRQNVAEIECKCTKVQLTWPALLKSSFGL
jgi:hypothetical protein